MQTVDDKPLSFSNLAEMSDDDLTALLNVVEDDVAREVFADYIGLVYPSLIDYGWGLVSSKSKEFSTPGRELFDQSMLAHITTGVYALVRLYEIEPDLCSADDLRTAVAAYVSHDYHKVRNIDYTKQFDITREEVEAFVEEVDLDSFAPTATTDDYIGAIALLHAKSPFSKKAAATIEFDRIRPLLLFADALASTSSVEDFDHNHNAGRHLRAVLGGQYTLNTHKLDRLHGLTTNVLNKSVMQVMEALGYPVLAIYQDGCVYVGDQKQAAVELTPEIVQAIFDSVHDNLRNTHPAFQHPDMMLEGFPFEDSNRYYLISPRDYFFATPTEIVEAVAARGIVDAEAQSAFPKLEAEKLTKLEADSGLSFEPTRRLDGMARLAHTLRVFILPELLEDSRNHPQWQYDILHAVYRLFDIPEETQRLIEDLELKDHKMYEDSKNWYVKYIIAAHLIDEFYVGEAPVDMIETVTEELIERLEEFPRWDGLREGLVAHYLDELHAFILETVTIDGQPLSDGVSRNPDKDDPEQALEVELVDGIRRYNRRLSGVRNEQTGPCVLCDHETLVNIQSPELIKTKPDIRIFHSDGTLHRLNVIEHIYCVPCQVDLTLRLERHDILESAGSNGGHEMNHMYVHVLPNYYYTPVSWSLYRAVFDNYVNINASRVTELARSVFNTDAARGFVEWTGDVTSAEGSELLSEPDIAFDPDTGFGSHALGHARKHNSPTHDIFVALAAATHAGVRVNISPNPMSTVTASDFQSAVRISPEYKLFHTLTGGEIRLSELKNATATVAAMILLCDKLGVTRDPLQYLVDMAGSTPLPGSKMLVDIAQKDPEGAFDYVAPARHIDEMLVEAYTHSGDERVPTWAFDITPNAGIIRPNELHRATETMAAYAWPFMSPQTFAVGELSAPVLAAVGSVNTAYQAYGDTLSAYEYANAIEQSVAYTLDITPSTPGRNFGGRLAGFAECFVDDILSRIGRGQPKNVERLCAPIRDAFYAAVFELATKSLTPDEVTR